MSNNLRVLPIHSRGRFFFSPIIGCAARCKYCYVYSDGYGSKVGMNEIPITEIMSWLTTHPNFKSGLKGSMLSIGAFGDPFPPHIDKDITIDWLQHLSSLGNPIQISTKYWLSSDEVKKIVKSVSYADRLLMSTSICTFRNCNDIDTDASSPNMRLATLDRFKDLGVHTNVLIKPFLPGITDQDTAKFIDEIQKREICTCVVGVLYWDERILKILRNERLTSERLSKVMFNGGFDHSLVCNPKSQYKTYHGKLLNDFCLDLKQAGISVFKNLGCAHAWLLKVPRIEPFFHDDKTGLCVRCGNCVD